MPDGHTPPHPIIACPGRASRSLTPHTVRGYDGSTTTYSPGRAAFAHHHRRWHARDGLYGLARGSPGTMCPVNKRYALRAIPSLHPLTTCPPGTPGHIRPSIARPGLYGLTRGIPGTMCPVNKRYALRAIASLHPLTVCHQGMPGHVPDGHTLPHPMMACPGRASRSLATYTVRGYDGPTTTYSPGRAAFAHHHRRWHARDGHHAC